MTDTKYNGWANYATWRVNLEMIEADYWFEIITPDMDEVDLMYALKDWAEDFIYESTNEGLGRDYALAFLSDVNWIEIAVYLKAEFLANEVTA